MTLKGTLGRVPVLWQATAARPLQRIASTLFAATRCSSSSPNPMQDEKRLLPVEHSGRVPVRGPPSALCWLPASGRDRRLHGPANGTLCTALGDVLASL